MCTSDKEKERISYENLLRENVNFRWFICSYIVTHGGEWLTYVASVSMIEDGREASRISISILLVLRLLPSIFIGPWGGVLADRYDRRVVMILLDILAAVVALLYLLSYRLQSISLLYVSTLLQECITGLYEPSRSAIVPMLVPKKYIPKATTLTGMTWSTMTAVGAGVSGFIVSSFGVPACFLIDSATYLFSAALLSATTGNYRATDETDDTKICLDSSLTEESESDEEEETLVVDGGETGHAKRSANREDESFAKMKGQSRVVSSSQMIYQAFIYLGSTPYGLIVLVKGCAALLFGASDVITVVFAERHGELDSQRLGWMFSAVGIGCLLGPTLLDRFWRAHEQGQLHAWQWASSFGYGVVGLGYVMLGIMPRYWLKCSWNAIRASGTAVLWIDSSQILQETVPQHLLGRVMAIDLALATAGEAVSAIVGGVLLDRNLLSADGLSIWLGVSGISFCMCWIVYTFIVQRRLEAKTNRNLEMAPLQPANAELSV